MSAHVISSVPGGEHTTEDRALLYAATMDAAPGSDSVYAATLFDLAPIGMLLYRADGQIDRANPAVCKLLGYTEREIIALGERLTSADDRHLDESIRDRLTSLGILIVSERKRFVRSNGELIHARLKVLAERDVAGALRRYLVQIIDMTERHSLRNQLQQIGRIDLLTRLPNRLATVVDLRSAVTRAKDGGQLGFLFLNIDRFQIINDALGPKFGDELLRLISYRLKSHVPSIASIGRIGGDEFAITLPAADETAVSRLAMRLIEALREPFRIGKRLLNVSMSIGVSCYPKDGDDADTLLKRADLAMQQAKLSKSGYQCYAEHVAHYDAEWLMKQTRLIDAIRRSDFELEFQTIRDTVGHKVEFVEALVRWRDGDQLVQPNEFIPIAETTGIIRDIDAMVVGMALQALSENQLRTHAVSVNLSPISLRDKKLLERVKMLLAFHQLPGSALIVEMTETALITDYAQTKDNISALRDTGVRFAIDDFGAGYTSLALLRTLKVDLLKIDKTFIAGIGTHRVDETIIGAIIDLSRDMQIETVAEGVETVAQRQWLRSRGCNFYQGFIDNFDT